MINNLSKNVRYGDKLKLNCASQLFDILRIKFFYFKYDYSEFLYSTRGRCDELKKKSRFLWTDDKSICNLLYLIKISDNIV